MRSVGGEGMSSYLDLSPKTMMEIMFRKLLLITCIALLSGCGFMPGMQNPNTSRMTIVHTPETQIRPILISITPQIISQQAISYYSYHVAPADVLNISIWQHPEFTSKELYANQLTGVPSTQGAAGKEGYLVNAKGYIYFPLIGNVFVEGKTMDQIRHDMTIRLKRYLRNPALNVRVVDFRGQKVYLFGEIMRPGFVPITDQPLSITDAISLTGGFNPNSADPEHIYVIRGNIYRPTVYWLNAQTPDLLLQRNGTVS
jgi:polysaccharide export outer membrane protein